MKLTDIVRRGYGTAGAWHVTRNDGMYQLWHYGTLMLEWEHNSNSSKPHVVQAHVGWGSVSDQQGMNKAFNALGLPHYFVRKDGARIEDRQGNVYV
jgi:hypothetical protein